MIRPFLVVASGVLAVLSPLPAAAHAFGQRYDLPLPFWLYTTGAGATVALSFVIMAMFLRRGHGNPESISLNLLSIPALRWLGHNWTVRVVESASVGIFLLILSACFFGNPGPFDNIAPTFVWVVWWVGLAFISALAGNLWDLVNPWRILFQWTRSLLGGGKASRPYPAWLGYWPAVLLFLAFAWLELISTAAEKPRNLGGFIILYSAVAWIGMARFGGDAWLRYGEVFSVVFGTIARFAPLAGNNRELWLRLPATGLLSRDPVPLSYVFFVLLLLTSVTFDGILETPFWQAVVVWISESTALRGALLFLQQAGFDLLGLIKSLALVLLPLVFIAAFLAVGWLVGWAGGARLGLRDIAGYFVLSLVPIAIAYHLSHYLSYFLIAGQNIIPLASDPFGIGWDLFGGKSYRLDLGIVNAKMVWYVAVSAIVAGHVIAVYVAHVTALRIFPTVRQALYSQFPMMVLMVGYTMVSLWILSQPIVA